MELRIDRQALVPVVQQIVDALTSWVRQGTVEPGTRLPSIRQLARENLLSQASVHDAYQRLVAQGVLASRNGSSFLSPSLLRQGSRQAASGSRTHCPPSPARPATRNKS